ncbi:MAG TPA: hypothetical protein VGS15_01470 [Candidatus Acidoferrales bacterium]|nr:hypothetical protein [Candidatus Acidoferrales bacterium]
MTCERYQLWMTDAATGGLSAPQQTEFELHICECTRCREDYGRVRALLQEIDRGIVSRCDAAPSVEFLARVRRRITAESAPAKVIWSPWTPAAACAAVLVIASAIWMTWPRGAKPHGVASTKSGDTSLATASHVAPDASGTGSEVVHTNPAPSVAAVRRIAARSSRRVERQPNALQVIVPPGQVKALMQLVAALQSGKIDGAKLLSEQQGADQPIDIKPLVIPLLDNTSQAQDRSSASDGQGAIREFVSGKSAQGLLP